MLKDRKYDYDIYKITTKEQLDVKKIGILILLAIVVICLVIIVKNSIELINQHKVYKQYEAQLLALQKQEEDKQADDKKADDSEEDKDKKDKFVKDEEDKDDDKEDKPSDDDKDEKDDKDDDKEKYALLESNYNELQSQFSALQSECQELRAFKATIENERKDALINSFYMLSDEDKADVIANKSQYSLDEIESKLSVICVRKKVNFTVEEVNEPESTQEVVTTFNLGDVDSNIPSWIKAVRQTAQELG